MITIISFDVEVDGRIPGRNSIRQLGAVAFNTAGKELSHFCMNLEPLPRATTGKSTMDWWATQPKERWDRVAKNPKPPKVGNGNVLRLDGSV